MRTLAAAVLSGALLLAGAPGAGAAQWAMQPAVVPPGPPDGQLNGVACLRRGTCFAVGTNTDLIGARAPQVQYFNGRWWRRLSVPPGAGNFDSISCRSGSSCVAVGSLVERWNGRRWRVEYRLRAGSQLEGVACPTARTCVAVGSVAGRALALRWNGHRWRRTAVSGDFLSGVSCSSGSACTAVGARGSRTLAVRWNGRRWRAQATPTPDFYGGLQAVSCPTARVCLAVGAQGFGGATYSLAERWNGSRWSLDTTPQRKADVTTLDAISCSSPRDCVATGWYGSDSAPQGAGTASPLSEHWNGRAWSAREITNPTGANVAELAAVSCMRPGRCVGVGHFSTGDGPYYQSRDLALHLAGGWRLHGVPTPPGRSDSSLQAVSCAAATNCVAVGSQSRPGCCQVVLLDERWDGHAWRLDTLPQPPGALTSSLVAISCVSTRWCLAVGSSRGAGHRNATLTELWDGSSWRIEPSPNGALDADNYLNKLACVSTTDCVAVGDYYNDQASTGGTLIEHWNGTDWAAESSATSSIFGANLSGVSCTSSDACIAVGQDGSGRGIAQRWDGVGWSSVPGPSSSLDAVSCGSSSSCQAVGFQEIARWNGSAWSPAPTPALSAWRLMDVACLTDNACTAVGATKIGSGSPAALAESWDGQRWLVQSTPSLSGSTLGGVACPAPSTCVAVGSYSHSPLIEASASGK